MARIEDRVAGNPVTATWGNSIRDASVMQVLASEVASIVGVEGQLIYVTDEDTYYSYTGAAWVKYGNNQGWLSWTPSYTGITQGTGATNTGAYTQVGRLVMFYSKLTLGTSPLYASNIYITLPTGTTASRVNGQVFMLRGAAVATWFLHGGVGVTQAQFVYPGSGYTTAATAGQVTGTYNVAGYPTATASDVIETTGWYVTT